MNKTALTMISALFILSCSSSNHRPAPVDDISATNKKSHSQTATKSKSQKIAVSEPSRSTSSTKETLLKHYKEWKGVTYKYGGLSKRGIDCSGFVYLTYRDLFDTNVPRSTKLLASTGDKINQSQLQPGDLVLYKTSFTVRHAGIYMGNNKFLHASKSKGVMISDMDLDYWKDRYWQARRVL